MTYSQVMFIHFIWTGGLVPPEYIRNVMTFLHPNVIIRLYVDKTSCFYRSVFTDPFLSSLPMSIIEQIKVMEINDVVGTAEVEIPKTKLLNRFVLRESVGQYKNLGAVADVYRMYILYLFGGLYVDIDNSKKFCVDKDIMVEELQECKGIKIRPEKVLNNDILLVEKYSLLIKEAIEECLVRFNRSEKKDELWEVKRRPETKINVLFNRLASKMDKICRENGWDSKECKEIEGKMNRVASKMMTGRFEKTLTITGPGLLKDVIEMFYSVGSGLSYQGVLTFSFSTSSVIKKTHLAQRSDIMFSKEFIQSFHLRTDQNWNLSSKKLAWLTSLDC